MRVMGSEAPTNAGNGNANANGHSSTRPTPLRPKLGPTGGDSGVYLRAAEAAALLHVSPKTVSRWAKEGKIPHFVTLGGHRRFPKDAIEAIAAGLEDIDEG